MKNLIFIMMLILFSRIAGAEPSTTADKHWYVALGPVLTNSLVGSGTKYSIALGYDQGLSEHWSLGYFYIGNFNTASQGSTGISELGLGPKCYFDSRLSETALFLSADVGYGGGNRSTDANAIFGGSVGLDAFRSSTVTFEFAVRVFTQYTTGGGSLQNWPSGTQLLAGILF